MSSLLADTRVCRNPDLLVGVIDGETVLMSIESGAYFSLNPTAASIWSHLSLPKTINELNQLLTGEYDTEAEACLPDVVGFLTRMVEKDLIRLH